MNLFRRLFSTAKSEPLKQQEPTTSAPARQTPQQNKPAIEKPAVDITPYFRLAGVEMIPQRFQQNTLDVVQKEFSKGGVGFDSPRKISKDNKADAMWFHLGITSFDGKLISSQDDKQPIVCLFDTNDKLRMVSVALFRKNIKFLGLDAQDTDQLFFNKAEMNLEKLGFRLIGTHIERKDWSFWTMEANPTFYVVLKRGKDHGLLTEIECFTNDDTPKTIVFATPKSSAFILDGCDFSPEKFRDHTLESVQKTMTTSLVDSHEEEREEKCFVKRTAGFGRMFYFGQQSGLLREVYVSAKNDTDFLGINGDNPESALSLNGFKKIGALKVFANPWLVWNHKTHTQIYGLVHRSKQTGRLVEVFLFWKKDPYPASEIE